MAVTYGFFNSVNGDRKYNAEQMSEYFRGIINEGVYQHLDGGLAVTAGTGLAVNVAAGRAIIQNRWIQNSAAMSLTIAAASETYARKDAVVIRLNWSSRAISIVVKTGTPAASPVAPSMTRNSTTYEMALAYVNVAANATSVTVTDKRSDSTVCGWVTVAQSTSGEVDAQLNAMKTGFDGVEYSSPAAMVQGEDQKLQDQISDTIVSEDVHYSQWLYKTYVAGVQGNTSYKLSRIYDIPQNTISIHLAMTTRAYFDIYGWIDNQGNVISYVTEGGSSTSFDNTIIPPSNAVKMYICSTEAEVIAATVKANIFKANIDFEKITKESINPYKELSGYGIFTSNHQVSNEFAQNGSLLYFDVSTYDTVILTSKRTNYADIYTLYDSTDSVIGSAASAYADEFEISVDVSAASVMCVTVPQDYVRNVSVIGLYGVEITNKDFIHKSKIIWYGTSIPAAGKDGSTHPESYPNIVGNLIGASVENKAVGESCLSCKNESLISEGNPYGFINNFTAASRCLTNTIVEMQWIIDHFNDTSVFSYATVPSLSDDDKAFILSCSYENRLLPYLTPTTAPDIIVFDHGHNDGITDEKESVYITELTGTDGTGFYKDGVFVSSEYVQHRVYDVTDYKTCKISGTINGYYDIYTLLDAQDNVIAHLYNNTTIAKVLDDYIVDVYNAAKLVVSTGRLQLQEVTCNGIKKKNLYCYQGAMDFLLEMIYSYNPRMTVVMIGEYENELKPLISKYQLKVAESWEIPIYKQWEIYGWSQNSITTNWKWNTNGYWVKASTSQRITLLNANLCDGIHPHSDASGSTLQFMGKHIAEWMKTEIVVR